MPSPKTNSSESVIHAIKSRDIVDFSAYAPDLPRNPADPVVLAEMVSGLSAIADILLNYLQSVGEGKTVTASNGVITIPDAIGGLPTALVIPYHGEIVGEPSMDNPAEVIFPTPIRFKVNGEPYTFNPAGFAGLADVAKGTETVQKSAYVCTGDEDSWSVSGTGNNRYLRADGVMSTIYGSVVNYSSESNYFQNFSSQMSTSNTGYGISNQGRGIRARNDYIVNALKTTDAQKFVKDLYNSGVPLIVVVENATGVTRNCQMINILLQPGQNVIEFEDTGIGAFCTYRATPATAGLGAIRPGLGTSALTDKASTDVVEPVTDTIKEEE